MIRLKLNEYSFIIQNTKHPKNQILRKKSSLKDYPKIITEISSISFKISQDALNAMLLKS